MSIKEILEKGNITPLNGEIFKNIKGYDSVYLISNFGRVVSTNYRKMGIVTILKPSKNSLGYWKISLGKHGDKKATTFLVHRLVADHFLEKVEGLYTIGFKDGDKNNFKLENLYWK